MLKKLTSFFKKEEINKHIIVCIHGFGIRTTHQFDNFIHWNDNHFKMHTFPIFIMSDEEDCKPDIWMKRCENVVENFINAGYEVDLIGFSMGGVIASYLASKYNIGRLFLIAPAFEYFTPNNVIQKTKEKFEKKDENKIKLPSSFTPCFIDIVKKYKNSIKKVTCPVCIVHGDKDDTIPLKSSIDAIEAIEHSKKRLFIIHNGTHHLMTNTDTGYETFMLFKNFMDRVLLPEISTTFCKDIYEKRD